MNKAYIDIEKCIGCGDCIETCPRDCIELIDGKARIREDDCLGCMACENICPANAINMVVEADIIREPEQVENRTSIEKSESTPLIKSSTVKKAGKFLLNSSLALLTSPRVWRAIFGRSSSSGRRQGKSSGTSSLGRGPGQGRGRNRRHRGRMI